jgi:MraZ protein
VAGNAPSGYSGQGFSLRGEKDRYVLPPAFRNAIAPAADAPRTLCLAKHDRWNCLTGFGLSRTESFEELLDREEDNAIKLGKEFDRELRSLQLWTFSEVPFDASGRFVMPDHLAELCAIDQGLCLLGGGRFFTLWAPEQLYKMGAGWEAQQAVCRKLERDAGAKGKRK